MQEGRHIYMIACLFLFSNVMGISPSEMIRRLEALIPKIPDETRRIIERDPNTISSKYKEFQRGDRPDGSEIGFYGNRNYELFKRNKNPLAGGSVDLILTGAFTRGLFIERKSNLIYRFDSTDDKTDDLIAKYGMDIMGLNQNEWIRLQRDIHAPLLIRYIKRQLRQ